MGDGHSGGFADEKVTVLRRLGLRFGVLAKLDRRERTARNEVARIENLTKHPGRRVLVSSAFADLVLLDWESLGEQSVDGVERPITVLAPPPSRWTGSAP